MPLILLYIQYSFNAQHVSAVNTTILRSLRLTICYFIGGICKKYRGIVLATLKRNAYTHQTRYVKMQIQYLETLSQHATQHTLSP